MLRMLSAQRGALFPFAPVLLAIGIGAYFSLPSEPGPLALALLLGAAIALLGAVRLADEAWRLVWMAALLVVAGVLLGALRTQMVAAPVLKYRYFGPVEGRVIAVDRSFSDQPRLTLDQVWIDNTPPGRTPNRVRVALHAQQAGASVPRPGDLVGVTAHLSPPPAPAEPGGFNFQRKAWFGRIGAVGYSRAPPVRLGRDPSGWARIEGPRAAMSAALRARIGGDAGAFAAAILTGDRQAISRPALQNLRDSNLAHLLAISGLHMGLLTGFVFASVRTLGALVPYVALRWPVKKAAAVVALLAGCAYLALSGGSIATQRAFVMVATILVAVLLDRRAITLRAVALAALIILVTRPESLTEPGFQMSFAATTALVAAFNGLRNWPESWWRPGKVLGAVAAVAFSSAVAGLATAPFSAAHFNQVAQYGLLANITAVPVMGLIVIPFAVVGIVLAPFGLAGLGFWPMTMGIKWILAVSGFVAGLDGAVWHVPAPAAGVLPLIALGALWAMLWQGRAALAGCIPLVAAGAIWANTQRPDLLISESGALVGVMTPQGRAFNKPRGDGFVAQSWLENDGDSSTQALAVARGGFAGKAGLLQATLAGQRFVVLSGRGWQQALPAACSMGTVILRRIPESLPAGCTYIAPDITRKTGTIAIYLSQGGLHQVGAKQRAGARPWTW